MNSILETPMTYQDRSIVVCNTCFKVCECTLEDIKAHFAEKHGYTQEQLERIRYLGLDTMQIVQNKSIPLSCGRGIFETLADKMRFIDIIENCKHSSTTNYRGCDGTVVHDTHECNNCGITVSEQRSCVWND